MIPTNLRRGLDRYQHHHIKTGGFLEAVLSNDIEDAVGRADPNSLANLPAIQDYIKDTLPAESWGSREKVRAWIQNKGATDEPA